MVSEPERLVRLHFERVDGLWHLRYGLDIDANALLAIAVPDEDFEEIVNQAQDHPAADE